MSLIKLASDLFIQVRGYVQPAIDAMNKRIEESEKTLLDCIEIKLQSLPIPVNGVDGKDGAPGADGKDPDPEVIRQLVHDAVAGLPIPAAGKDGAPGLDGAPGENGKDADLEVIKRMVADSLAEALKHIQLPKDGDKGADGRDALDIEILPEIDTEKSYARGTYAKHLNGLWRSFERTSAMKGWECIVAGVAAAAIPESDDPRNLSITLTLSDGSSVEKNLHIPVAIYQGVYTPKQYSPGDTVSWSGSIWHCDQSTDDKPGEVGSKGWTLAVKRGRDGKDGRDGRDLVKGVSLK